MSDNKAHNVLVVATARDRIYSFDAYGNTHQAEYLWEKILVGPIFLAEQLENG